MSQQTQKFADIHSHFIFGVDDGSDNEITTLDMLSQACENNFTHLLATPHATDLTNDEVSGRFIQNFNAIQALIDEKNLSIKISLAAELFFSTKIYEWLKYPWSTFNNMRKYLLFELPMFELPQHVKDFIFQCKLEGITPILAHPERYSYMNRNLDSLLEWRRQGCFLQVNAGSITGQFGNRVQKLAYKLIESQAAQFVASDAHGITNRNYAQLVEARTLLQEQTNPDYLNQLFYENPLKAIEGKQIDAPEVNEYSFQESIFSWEGLKQNFYKVFHR